MARAANPLTPQDLDDGGPRSLVYTQRHEVVSRHKKQSAVGNALVPILRLAWLADTPGIRASGILEWKAEKTYEETGSVEHVGARLGMSSLDGADEGLGLNWTGLYDIDGPPGVPTPVRPRNRGENA